MLAQFVAIIALAVISLGLTFYSFIVGWGLSVHSWTAIIVAFAGQMLASTILALMKDQG